jgi:hypothetical protein
MHTRGHSLAVWAMYHWGATLIREGRWQEQPSVSRRRSAAPLQFARVAVTHSPRLSPLIVRVVLSNGRAASRAGPYLRMLASDQG